MWYIHINRGTIDHNRKYGTNDHPIAIKKGKSGKSVYCSRVRITNGEVVYEPNGHILQCGARLVIQSKEEPEIVS